MKCTCASNQPGVIKPPRRSTRSAVPASRARSDSRPTAATRPSRARRASAETPDRTWIRPPRNNVKLIRGSRRGRGGARTSPPRVSDGRDDPAIARELAHELGSDARRRRGYENAVIWSVRRKSDRRVSRDDADVFVAELGEHDTRAVRERGVPFDGHDIVRELCEHRGLISRPRAHLEHVMRRVDVQKLGHPRDDIWLRDRLTLRNSERVIAVRDVLVFLPDKTLARNLGHCSEHPFVLDAHTPEIADHEIRSEEHTSELQ